MVKKLIDVETAVSWAYRDEIPKKEVAGLTGWEKTIYLGTGIDDGHFESGFPVNLGPPHPDALLIDHAVRSLGDVTMLWEHEGPGIMGDLLPYAPLEDPVLRRMQFSPCALVTLHARMGTRPCWDLGPLKLTRIIGKNGKPVVNGITEGRRYAEGANCPLRLDPSGYEMACARAEYLIWWQALHGLVAESWNLSEFALQYPRAAERPWKLDTERKPRILQDISARMRIA